MKPDFSGGSQSAVDAEQIERTAGTRGSHRIGQAISAVAAVLPVVQPLYERHP